MFPRAVVIGSGIGGAAAALLLAKEGIPTTLVEKNRRIGGSCSGYEKGGFKIDIGTHMFSRGPVGPLGEVLRRAGHDGEIKFRRTRDIAELRFVAPQNDGREKLIAVPMPAEVHRMPAFALELARAVNMSPLEVARTTRFFAHILAMSDRDVEGWDDRTVEEFVRPFTDHPPTIGIFGFLLGLYFILPYWEVSAGEALWAFRHMVKDNWLSYPLGGAIQIPATYCRLAKLYGADIRCGTPVRRIVVREGKTVGVELSDGTVLPANIVISTSSLRTTVTKLVGEEHFPAAYVTRAKSIRASYIATQAKVGLKKKLIESGALVGGVGDGVDLVSLGETDLRTMFQTLTEGRIPNVVPFYCPIPTNFDPSLAPPGRQLLTLCAVAPTSDIHLVDPAHKWEEAMLRTLRRVVPGIDDHILFIDTLSVEFIERWIGKEFGPAVSTGQTPGQVGKNRPPVYTPLKGLYLAGCGAGGRGVGTELAATSAMECVDRILADLGHTLVPRVSKTPLDIGLELVARAAKLPIARLTKAA